MQFCAVCLPDSDCDVADLKAHKGTPKEQAK